MLAPAVGLDDVADRLGGAGRTDRLAPAECAVIGRELLQFERNFGLRLTPILRGEFAVAEKMQAAGDAAHLQALGFDCVEALADDEFSTATADVDDQPALSRLGEVVRDTEIDQACFLATADDFDRMAERGFGGQQKRLRIGKQAHAVGRDRTHALGWQGTQALAEAREANQRTLASFRIQTAIRAQTHRHAHAVA